MRTTVSIQDNLLDQAKETAQRRKCTLSQVVEDALRAGLLDKKPSPKAKKIRLTTFGGEGVFPGVNLDSNSELLDLMDVP